MRKAENALGREICCVVNSSMWEQSRAPFLEIAVIGHRNCRRHEEPGVRVKLGSAVYCPLTLRELLLRVSFSPRSKGPKGSVHFAGSSEGLNKQENTK